MLKDHENYFEGLSQSPTPTDLQVPNTVSRYAKVGDRAFTQIVVESGKPILDAEVNLFQDAAWIREQLLRQWQAPSGWLRGRTHQDGYTDYIVETNTPGIDDPNGLLHVDGTLLDSFILPRKTALVAGLPVVVEFTNTSTDGYNLVDLEPPTIYDGSNPTVKRTDFVFLEVWKPLVAPSPRASGQIQIVDAANITVGDTININGIPLTAVAGAPGIDEFQIGVDEPTTATNVANAVNDGANSFVTIVSALVNVDTVTLKAVTPGSTGNLITLSVTLTIVGSIVVSGATLSGGADRPNKPAQDKLYRHGNTQSPSATWLDDELVDPVIDIETTQRVQVQYRIRATSASEAVNYKKHPDGFSSLIAGGGPGDPAIFAQGNRSQPVWSGNGTDINSYPFVRADRSSVWLDSSAVAYGIEDDGLWVAGNGSERSAQDLGSIDGFVYALPICFVHRHNNVSDSLAGFRGFDPINNTNGAPLYDHAGYNGPLGAIAAGESDRPDAHFADVITQENLLDLRRHVIFPGVDLKAELQYQMQSLLDGNVRTWSVDVADKQVMGGDSGDVSTRFLVCNEIGRATGQGGNPPFSGDSTGRGVLIRNFDHIARRFADQPIVERVVFAFYPGDRPDGVSQGGPVAPGLENAGKYVVKSEDPGAPGVPKDPDGWYEDDILHIDLDNLDASTLGGIFQGLDGGGTSATGLPSSNFSAFAPPGTRITDVLEVFHDDGHYTNAVPQELQIKFVKGLGTRHLEVSLDANDSVVNGGDSGNPDGRMVGSDVGTPPVITPDGSQRRIFLEVEITYPIGMGLTDTPDHEVTPSPVVYDGDGQGPGPLIETSTGQRPNDFETILAPRFRNGFREVQLEYVANDTVSIMLGMSNPGSPIGSVNPEQIVSRDQLTLYFPRRVFGTSAGPLANQTSVVDAVTITNKPIDETQTDFGSSSRKVTITNPLSGAGQTLCDIQYFAQDPIPNYGASGGGYQVSAYYRTNAPQTAGVKEGDINTTGDGTLPTILQVEPLLMSDNVWTGQIGMGGQETGFPYASPLDQIPINDGTVLNPADPNQQAGVTREWYFAASASVAIDDFNANTGLLALHPFVQGDIQNMIEIGGLGNDEKPRKDAEFRAYYPQTDPNTYRPTILSQPLSGATRHKVMVPFLARVVQDSPGVAGGILFRKSELILVVLSRFAAIDDQNNVRFIEPATENRTMAAVYRTRNLLLTVRGN